MRILGIVAKDKRYSESSLYFRELGFHALEFRRQVSELRAVLFDDLGRSLRKEALVGKLLCQASPRPWPASRAPSAGGRARRRSRLGRRARCRPRCRCRARPSSSRASQHVRRWRARRVGHVLDERALGVEQCHVVGGRPSRPRRAPASARCDSERASNARPRWSRTRGRWRARNRRRRTGQAPWRRATTRRSGTGPPSGRTAAPGRSPR